MDALKSPSKSTKKKSFFSKAKGLIRHNRSFDEDDNTGETDTQWKSESELGFDPAQQSPVTPSSLPDYNKRIIKQRRNQRKTPSSKEVGSPGSLAGQKVRRTPQIESLAGLPLEMDSVNDTEMAVISPTKKKTKRRKSLGSMNDAKEKARGARESGKKSEKKRSNSQPRVSTKGLTGKSNSTRNTGEGVNDLMAHLGPPPETEGELKDGVVLSPNGKARTTVDRDGKIRRVASKKKLEVEESNDSDGEHSKKSAKSKMSARNATGRKSKKSKDGEGKKKRRPVPGIDEDSVFSDQGSKKERRGDRKGSKDLDHSGHSGKSDKSEMSEKKLSKKKMSRRELTDWGNSSDCSIKSDKSEKKLSKKKSSKRDLLDISEHDTSKAERSKRDLDTSDHSAKSDRSKRRDKNAERRAGKRGDGLSPATTPKGRPMRAKSVPDLPFNFEREDSGLKRIGSLTPPNSDKSLDKADSALSAGSPGSDKTNARILQLQQENENALTEISKLRKELRDVKLESQRSQTERRELRADLRERDFIIKESDMRIEALEKAVESQLDKIEDLEDELRRANEEVFVLEEKLSHMEDRLADTAGGVDGAQKEREMDQKRQERLERRLEEKERDLVERENALKEERRMLLSHGQANRTVDQLEVDNRMLLKAMNREKAEAEEKLLEKDAEIEALKTELRRKEMNGSAEAYSNAGDDSSTSALLHKKDDQIAFLERELKRLKEELEDRDLGDFDKIKRELQAAKNEGMAMKSKYEGAQRRNLILEDEIDHWKSVNCNLEDDLAEMKTQAANWRQKYENVVDVPDEDDNIGGPGMNYGMSRNDARSAGEIAMNRGDDSDEDERNVNTISGLWSKLTTPQSSKKKSVGGNLPSGSLKEVIARSTFH